MDSISRSFAYQVCHESKAKFRSPNTNLLKLAGDFSGVPVYQADQKQIEGVRNGFIVSPEYPTFAYGISNLNFTLKPAANFEYRLYSVDVAMSVE